MDKAVEYEIIRSSRKTLAIQVKDGRVLVRAPLRVSRREIDAFVRKNTGWIMKQMKKQEARVQETEKEVPFSEAEMKELHRQARLVIPPRVEAYAKKIGVTYGKITIRSQRTRWGSCSSKGNLNFNCLLMLAPVEVLDSVIVHELCHRIEMNHSGKFYREVLRVFPEYYTWHKWLKENGDRLIRRLP